MERYGFDEVLEKLYNAKEGIEHSIGIIESDQEGSCEDTDIRLIHTQGLDEGIRCAMCTNSMANDRGCDGGCVVNESMYKEEAINALKKFIDTVEEDTVAVSLNSEDVEVFKKAIEVLFHEPFKDAYIKQVVKERDVAVAQLNELGYSLGEKIRPCEKTVSIQDCINAIENTDCELSPQAWEEITNNIMSLPPVAPKQDPILSEARAKIEEQEKWLMQAGYNAYNVWIAFSAIKRVMEGK